MTLSAIGVGANLGDAHGTVHAAFAALTGVGEIVRRSRCYRTQAWGVRDQPAFVNAVVLVDTALEPQGLLASLQAIERRFGRIREERWGPRTLDLDILTFGEGRIDEPGLQVPHRHLAERAFALVPLADVDRRYRALASEVLGVEGGETVALMSEPPLDRLRLLAQAFVETDLVRLRIEEPSRDAVEFRRKVSRALAEPEPAVEPQGAVARPLEPIKSDLVGVVRFARPAPTVDEYLEKDRDLAYVEALGIRTPVRSKGAGRIASINVADGDPVEYAEVLFEIDRSER